MAEMADPAYTMLMSSLRAQLKAPNSELSQAVEGLFKNTWAEKESLKTEVKRIQAKLAAVEATKQEKEISIKQEIVNVDSPEFRSAEHLKAEIVARHDELEFLNHEMGNRRELLRAVDVELQDKKQQLENVRHLIHVKRTTLEMPPAVSSTHGAEIEGLATRIYMQAELLQQKQKELDQVRQDILQTTQEMQALKRDLTDSENTRDATQKELRELLTTVTNFLMAYRAQFKLTDDGRPRVGLESKMANPAERETFLKTILPSIITKIGQLVAKVDADQKIIQELKAKIEYKDSVIGKKKRPLGPHKAATPAKDDGETSQQGEAKRPKATLKSIFNKQ